MLKVDIIYLSIKSRYMFGRNLSSVIYRDGMLSVMLASEDGLKKKYFKYDLDRLCAIDYS